VTESAPVRIGRPEPETPPLYPAFVKAALFSTLTFGAGFGAFNLFVIHWPLPLSTPPTHHWTHAGFQIWGFVFLFTAGIAFHAVPRFLQSPLRFPRAARQVPWLTLGGQVLHSYGGIGELLPGTLPALALGALLQALAVGIFAGVLGATAKAARPAPQISLIFLAIGTLGWILAAAGLLGGAIEALLEGETDAAVSWHQAVYAAALFGGALSWIQGMFLRAGTSHLGLPPARPVPVLGALGLGQTGLALLLVGSLRLSRPGAFTWIDLGMLLIAVSVPVYLAGVRPFGGRDDPADPGWRLCLRLCFGGALLFAALGTAVSILDLRRGAPGLFFDGARHAYTLGFVTPFILAMASRILPAFRGIPPADPGRRTTGILLILAGAVLREAQILAALFQAPAFMKISALSGVVATLGIVLVSHSLLKTLREPLPSGR
jgi:hypothetical protein